MQLGDTDIYTYAYMDLARKDGHLDRAYSVHISTFRRAHAVYYNVYYICTTRLAIYYIYTASLAAIYYIRTATSGKCSQDECQVSFVKRIWRNWRAIG